MLNRAVLGTAFGLLASCAPHRIVYSSQAAPHHLMEARLGDGAPVRLTASSGSDRFPRCSGDGRQILFVREGAGGRDIVLVDRTGAERYLTRDAAADSSPTWAPDGREIYFTRRVQEHDRIARLPLSGGPIEYLTDGAAHDTMPAVSPTGRLLVHHSYRYGHETELQLIDLQTGAARRLTSSPGSDYEASFAGDDAVVFSSNLGGGHFRIYRLELSNGVVQLLADTGADAWGPRYSRRSGRVLFYSGRPGQWRMWTVPLSGGTPRPVRAAISGYGGDWCLR